MLAAALFHLTYNDLLRQVSHYYLSYATIDLQRHHTNSMAVRYLQHRNHTTSDAWYLRDKQTHTLRFSVAKHASRIRMNPQGIIKIKMLAAFEGCYEHRLWHARIRRRLNKPHLVDLVSFYMLCNRRTVIK